MTELEKALEHAQRLMDIEGVVGVAQGEKDGRDCIVVFLVKEYGELIEGIPSEILGVPVEIRSTEEFTVQDR